jgi:hypothetical protein
VIQDKFDYHYHHQFDGTNYAQWRTVMALLHEPKQVYGIIKEYHDKPEEPTANMTDTE